MLKLGAIDIGSNAMRLTIAQIDSHLKIKRLENKRQAVRLGQDAFSVGVFTPETFKRAVEALKAFRTTLDKYEVHHLRAVGTSAMREAANGPELAQRIREECNIPIEIISGNEEARLIQQAVMDRLDIRDKTCLFIDIGGGSVEITVVENQDLVFAQTFPLGTVRLLNQVSGPEKTWTDQIRSMAFEKLKPMTRLLIQHCHGVAFDACVGTGGNIECLGELRKSYLNKSKNNLLTERNLEDLIQKLCASNYEERLKKFNLRRDRADVIIPASIVLQMVLHKTGLHQVTIPFVSLKEGILLELMRKILKHDQHFGKSWLLQHPRLHAIHNP